MERLCPRFGDGVMSIRDIVQAAAGVGGDKLYIEDVFSTYLYDGTGAAKTITNGVDLDGEGGMVWTKVRNNNGTHRINDSVRGVSNGLRVDTTSADQTVSNGITAFNSDGYTLGTDSGNSGYNFAAGGLYTYASWTFRKAPKFFDIVTYTGDGTTGRLISHNLESRPGFIVIKRTDSTGNWFTCARVDDNTARVSDATPFALNSNADSDLGSWATIANSTTINLNMGGLAARSTTTSNINGATYVAYLWAHNAGGFGDDGEQNVISCGSVVGANQQEVNLGFEPQWILLKNANSAQDWWMVDNMRGWPVQGTDTSYSARRLNANLSSAESTLSIAPSATGFKANTMTVGQTYIYMAIRRPMKPPEVGTEVFNSIARTGTGATASVEPGFVTDLLIDQRRSAGGDGGVVWDRLRGAEKYLFTRTTGSEGTTNNSLTSFANMNGVTVGSDSAQITNVNNVPWINWMFKRAPGFMDVVCDTGTGSAKTEAHNLGVVPELIIRKSRSNSGPYWLVGSTYLSFSNDEYLQLSTTGATQVGGGSYWNSTAPTSSVFSVGNNSYSNGNNYTFVNYLFATLAGVSKVGSYTGTGADLNVDCGFSAGARFILIKRTDSTGDWYVWDSVRGIVSGNDPYILLNSNAAEVTSTDYIDPLASGFTVTSSAPAALNASGGSYIFLAIA